MKNNLIVCSKCKGIGVVDYPFLCDKCKGKGYIDIDEIRKKLDSLEYQIKARSEIADGIMKAWKVVQDYQSRFMFNKN